MKKIYFVIFLVALVVPALAMDNLPEPVSDADYHHVWETEALLGRDLFYDPILSGNKTVACATCHHPKFGTADGVSLSIGDGGIGLGPDRRPDPDNWPEKAIPRNAPALFNLGAKEFTVMFHDGRLEADPAHPAGIRSPLDADMMVGFRSVLSAQTMFPVLSRDEMAGSYHENEVAKAVRQGRITGPDGAWDLLSRRVANVPEYAARFLAIYPHLSSKEDIDFTDISNAIAAFMAFEWRSDDAPFDQVLRGDLVLDAQAQAGLELFYGTAGCATCHSGPFQTDHRFHAVGTVQIGPGKSADFEDHQRDEGRFRVTGERKDLFAFRTPSLRNVMATAPYGHAGAHKDLREFLKAHNNPIEGLRSYDTGQALLVLPQGDNFNVVNDDFQISEIASQNIMAAPVLSEPDIEKIIAFLETLTEEQAIAGRLGVPNQVPSGLPVP